MTKHECPYGQKARPAFVGYHYSFGYLWCGDEGRLCDRCKEDRVDERIAAVVRAIEKHADRVESTASKFANRLDGAVNRIVEAIAVHEERADWRADHIAKSIAANTLITKAGGWCAFDVKAAREHLRRILTGDKEAGDDRD